MAHFFSANTRKEVSSPDLKIHIDEDRALEKFSRILGSTLAKLLSDPPCKDIVVMCIGTDRSTGDCLGPLVGSKLAEHPLNSFTIMGTLDDPVHAANLAEKLEILKQMENSPFVIAIDACLGRLDSVGLMNIGVGSLRPGAGVHKALPAVGQLNITGIVNVGGFMEYFVLQNTRLSTVMRMANIISRSLLYCNQALKAGKLHKIYTQGIN